MVIEALERRFGPEWRSAPGIGDRGVAAFEQAHGITLPEPYRTFVAESANGAAGPPDYGLVPLGAPAHSSGGYEITPGSLARPFPLTEPWVWEDDEYLNEERLAAVRSHGALPLGTDGDGQDYVLIVTGPARGQVWLIADVGAVPVAHDFGRWVGGDLLPDAPEPVEREASPT